MSEKQKLAIVGTGMAGMSAAYFLKDTYDITVFEKNDYVGGHTNTIEFDYDGERVKFDTGFMVFNEVTYPNMLKLFKKLGVTYVDTSMSFSVRYDKDKTEYNGSSLSGLFAQRKKLFSPRHIRMLLHIDRFNKHAQTVLSSPKYEDMTVEEYVEAEKLSEDFLYKFLIPMSGAVWSSPEDEMLRFPIKSLVRFFYNHGFMGLDTQHQWKTCTQRSEEYKQLIIKDYREKIKTSSQVEYVDVRDNKCFVKVNGQEHEFDKVVMASHGDETLRMLKNPTDKQLKYLSAYKYQKNIATVHTDETVMPHMKTNWCAWNYVTRNNGDNYTVYYMNELQRCSEKNDFFININGEQYVDESKIIKQIEYHHPLFDVEAVQTQAVLQELNTDDEPLYFCGSYFRYGFHEDALLSSVEMCNRILKAEVL